MSSRVVVLPGDGIGPEVVAAATSVLLRIAELGGHRIALVEAELGGGALDRLGEALPTSTLEACEDADAALLGAVGGPRWTNHLPEKALLALRSHFGLFANLRPIPAFESLVASAPLKAELLAGVDILFVRELTGGIYFGERHEASEPDREAWDTMRYSAVEVERIARVAFKAAQIRKQRVTSVDKANVLASSRLWRQVVTEVGADFPNIELDHQLVDSFAMALVTRPADFDVVVAGNLFGDILSDEASVLAGSLGVLPSASLGEGTFGLYEPVHGSAPDIAGRGIANPLGTILSVALLLRYSLGLEDEAKLVEEAVERVLGRGIGTPDLVVDAKRRVSTAELGRMVVEELSRS